MEGLTSPMMRRDGTPPPERAKTVPAHGNGMGGDRLPERGKTEEKDPVRFDGRRNQMHRYRERSPVYRGDSPAVSKGLTRSPVHREDLARQKAKDGEKGGGKRSNRVNSFNNWWVRKDLKRGKGQGAKDGGRPGGKGKGKKGKNGS